MWRFHRQNFIENEHRKCISIGKNGNFNGDQIKTLYMEPDWSFQDFLKAGSQRLDIVPLATRVFTIDGVEIDDCLMIEDDDILFLSTNGEDFLMPSNANNQQVDLSNNDTIKGEESMIIHGYQVSIVLGRGGFGEVRLGEHTVTSEKVALKFLRKSDISTIGAAERTVTEIQCLATLKHTNIIKLLHHTETANHVILIFELMEGRDLMKFLCKRGDTPAEVALSEEECRPLFHQIISGVSYAHNNHICHRDLKLENILLKGPNLSIVKIADFGLSDFYRPGSTMRSNCGTLSFLSPEVFRGTSNAGPPLDVWSLGVILFAVLNGRLPFEDCCLSNRKRPRDAIVKSRILKGQYKIDERLSTEVKDLLKRLMKIDPEERASIPEVLSHCWMRQHQPIFVQETTKLSSFSRPRLPSNGLIKVESISKIGAISTAITAKSSFSTATPSESMRDVPPPSAAIDSIDEDSLHALVIHSDTSSASASRQASMQYHPMNGDRQPSVHEYDVVRDVSTPPRFPSAGQSINTSRRASKDQSYDGTSSTFGSLRKDSYIPPSSSSSSSLAYSPYDSMSLSKSSSISSSSNPALLFAALDIIGSPVIISSSKDRRKSEEEILSVNHTLPVSTTASPRSLASSSGSNNSMNCKDNIPQVLQSPLDVSGTSANNPPSTSSSPFKLIPLRRDRSISRTPDENIRSDDDKVTVVQKSPSKYAQVDSSNLDDIVDIISSLPNASSKAATHPPLLNRQNSGNHGGTKSFQRNTISSSFQSNLPSTNARIFERERSNRSNVSTSSFSSLHNISSQSSINSYSSQPSNSTINSTGQSDDGSPCITPRMTPPKNGRKETLADFAIEEENDHHDDDGSSTRTSKPHRSHRHRQRSSSLTGSSINKRDIPTSSSSSSIKTSDSHLQIDKPLISSHPAAEGIASSIAKK